MLEQATNAYVGSHSGATLSPVGSPQNRERRRLPGVFVIWDIEAVSIPTSSTAVRTVQSLLRLGNRHGAVERFECICRQGSLPMLTRRDLQDSGVVVEEIFSEESEAVHVFIVTQLFSIALSLSKSIVSPKHSPLSSLSSREAAIKSSTSSAASFTFFSSSSLPSTTTKHHFASEKEKRFEEGDSSLLSSAPRPTLILITNNRHFARALGVLRRSGLFSSLILLHSADTSEILTEAASWAMEWSSFLGVKPETDKLKSGKKDFPIEEPAPFAVESRELEESEKGVHSHSRASDSEIRIQDMSSDEAHSGFVDSLSYYSGLTLSDQKQGYTASESVSTRDNHFSKFRTTTYASPLLTAASPFSPPRSSRDASVVDSTSGSSPWLPSVFPRPTESHTRSFSADSPAYQSPIEAESKDMRMLLSASPDTSTMSPTTFSAPAQQTGDSSREIQEFRTFLSRTLDQYRDTTDDLPVSTSALQIQEEKSALPSKLFSSSSSTDSVAQTSKTLSAALKLSGPDEVQAKSSSPSRRKINMKRLSRIQKHALILFDKVIDECREEMIIPRESVVRSRIELHLLPKASKKGGKYLKRSWSGSLSGEYPDLPGMGNLKVPLRFDKWLQVLEEVGALQIEGIKPQRVLWPIEGRFECADYFQPHERLSPEEVQKLIQFFEENRPQVDRGRYGLASYLKIRGPNFIRNMPRGFIVELVQLLLNKHVLVFRKGKVSYAPMGINSVGSSAFVEEKFGSERTLPAAEGLGPALPPTIRRSIARLLKANPRLANEVTDDPVGVLAFLCARSLPTSGSGGRLRRMPMYHFEKSGLLHAPMWVCVATVEVAGLGHQEMKTGIKPSEKSVSRSRMLRYKQFETPKRARKQEAHQEAALAILEEVYWNLAFNVCLNAITTRGEKKEKKKTEDAELSPESKDGKDRETLVEAVLAGNMNLRDSAQDPCLRLDRVLLALDQKPCVYDVSATKSKNGSQQTLWTYSVDLQLRPRCNMFQDSKDSDRDQAFPALSSTSLSPSLTSSPSTGRYPPIQRSFSSCKKEEPKAEVAAYVLQRIRVYQLKYPLLFQPSLSTEMLPPATATASPSTSTSTIRDREPVAREPVAREPIVREPIVREPIVREPIVHAVTSQPRRPQTATQLGGVSASPSSVALGVPWTHPSIHSGSLRMTPPGLSLPPTSSSRSALHFLRHP